jgi:hypothetical protein
VRDDLLAAHPGAAVRVYAVWVDRRPGDSRAAWDAGLLTDPRVRHYWDGEDRTGRWFADLVPGYRGADWDAYALFGPAATWDDVPGPLVGSGSTVVAQKDDLARAVGRLLHDPAMSAVTVAL